LRNAYGDVNEVWMPWALIERAVRQEAADTSDHRLIFAAASAVNSEPMLYCSCGLWQWTTAVRDVDLSHFRGQEAADTSGLREAAAAWAETGPESREGNCGPLGVTPTDEGPEADDWCDRPAGHSGPHINVDNRDAYLRAALEGATERPLDGPA
jgi:hypothetical protein